MRLGQPGTGIIIGGIDSADYQIILRKFPQGPIEYGVAVFLVFPYFTLTSKIGMRIWSSSQPSEDAK